MQRSLADRTRRKIAFRILSLVFVRYMIAYLDRANVAFGKLSMSADLGFSDAVFGFGAGIFFLGYFLLEIPGSLIVERWSARRWMFIPAFLELEHWCRPEARTTRLVLVTVFRNP